MCSAEVLASMGLIKAASLRIDLSIGKYNSGFTDLISGQFFPKQDALDFNFSLIDTLAEGLQAQKVRQVADSPLLQVHALVCTCVCPRPRCEVCGLYHR